ncbi:MAG TPA: flagellar hook-basal body complex protein [Clostridia bacterium]|nr:flagellar hook-basal body complex protein [Clostridia bacterium]
MYRALHTGRTGMKAYQDKLDVVSNNLANSQTDGYKKIETDFVSLLKDSIRGQFANASENAEGTILMGTGVKTDNTYRVLDQGILVGEENPMTLALEGQGFFGLENESGDLLLTRDGHFGISAEGGIVNGNGFLVNLKDSESLEGLMPDQIEISGGGEIFSTFEDGERKSMGKLRIYKVSSPEVLTDAGNGCFMAGEEYVEEIEFDENSETVVRQGYTEKSNVDIGQEMIDMMISQRAYQMNARAVQSADDMWSLINNIKR